MNANIHICPKCQAEYLYDAPACFLCSLPTPQEPIEGPRELEGRPDFESPEDR